MNKKVKYMLYLFLFCLISCDNEKIQKLQNELLTLSKEKTALNIELTNEKHKKDSLQHVIQTDNENILNVLKIKTDSIKNSAEKITELNDSIIKLQNIIKDKKIKMNKLKELIN